MQRKLTLLTIFQLVAIFSNAQLIINEFSNGSTGSKEFFELLTVGTPGTMVDIRGWIIDDHSGYYGCSSGNGIAPGHIRLAMHSNWQCVPVGSIILIYNPSDKNPAISLPDDPTDVNQDGVYVLPVSSSPYIQAITSSPSSSSCNNFSGTYGNSSSWSTVALGNSTDAVVVVDPANTSSAYHGAGYGSLNGTNPPIYFSGSGSGSNYSFTNGSSNDWNLQANWTKSSAASNDSPGQPNNSANQSFIASLQLDATANYTAGCAPVTVSFSTTAAGATGHTYGWVFGDGSTSATANTSHTYTASGNYSATLTVTSPTGCTLTKTVQVSISGTAVSAPAISALCSNAQPVSLPSGTPAGGVWSGPGVSNGMFNPSSVTPGNVDLVYAVSGACGGSDTISVQVDANPQATLTSTDTLLCSSTLTASLSGTPSGGVFAGSGVSGTTFNPSALVAGVYPVTYTVTTGAGCTASDTIDIHVETTPSFNWSLPDTFCSNVNKLFIGGASPAGGVYQYNNQNLATDSLPVSSLNPLGNSHNVFYEITQPSGCTYSDTQHFVIEDMPAVAIQITGDTVLCSSESVTLTASSSSQITWSTGATTPSITPNQTATYTLQKTNFCGTAQDQVYIEFIPDVQINWNLADTFCTSTGDVFIGGANPIGGVYSYQNLPVANEIIAIGSLNPTGVTNQVIYTHSNFGCPTSDTQNFVLETDPTVQIQSSGDTIFCEDQPITLTASGVGSLSWSNGSTQASIQPTSSGIYSASRSNFCGNAIANQSVEVMQQPTLSVNQYEAEICPNETAEFIATSNSSPVLWSSKDTGSVFTANRPGSYAVSASNKCGVITEQVKVTRKAIETEIDVLDLDDNLYQFSAISSNTWNYTWHINNSLVSNSQDFEHQFNGLGIHSIALMAENNEGCTAFDTIIIESESVGALFIPNTFTPNGDGLNDLLRVVGDDPKTFKAMVFNRWGNQIAEWNDFYDGWDGKHNGQPCAEGVYIFRVLYNDKEYIRSVMLLVKS